MNATTELVPSVSIANMLNQRDAVLEKLGAAFDLVREAQQLATAGHLGFPDIGLSENGSRDIDHKIAASSDTPKQRAYDCARRQIDSVAWSYLMGQSGMQTFMDAEARAKWADGLRGKDVPELTMDNIKATFLDLHANRGEMFDRGVISLFRSLSYDYKTNKHVKFGKKIIMSYLFTTYSGGWMASNHGQINKLDDMDRVFYVMDGKPEPDHRTGWHSRIKSHMNPQPGEVAGDYFVVKYFKNGNAHITFTRPELVDRMNLILARHHPDALPAP